MQEELNNLRVKAFERKRDWENAKDPRHHTSIFVCNRRIQKLDEALGLIDEIEYIDGYTKRD